MTGVIPSTWATVKLSDVCQINPRDKSGLSDDDEVSFVPMAAVSEFSGSIVNPEARPLQDVKKGFTPFQEGDVLFAKITPCMENGKAAIARNLVNKRGYGSTEFHVIRPSSLVLAEWIFAIIRTSEFRRAAASSFQGAVGQQRVTSSFLEGFRIPLPPLSEQRRIVEILQEAEEIRRLRAAAEAKTAELIPAMFRGLFGEIGVNTDGWPTVPISHFVETFQGGKSLVGIENDFDASQPRVLKISAVTSGVLDPKESKALPSSYEPPDAHYVKPGDLLITRANTAELVGATALVGKGCPANLVLPDKIWRFVWKENFEGTPEFVWALFQEQATRKALGNIASGTGGSMKNISMKKLMQMRVIWPPRELQETFSEALREVADLRDDTAGDRISIDLQASLSAHVFAGQLTADWRTAHSDVLTIEANERDQALGFPQKGHSEVWVRKNLSSVGNRETPELLKFPDELNRDQFDLLFHIREQWAKREIDCYFTAEMLSKSIKGPLRRNPQAIEGHLVVLVARGLIIPVSREEQTESSGEFVFGNAYRLPSQARSDNEGNEDGQVLDDHARGRELERLAARLEKERAL